MIGSALRDARLRIAPRPAPNGLTQHLQDRYGLAVDGLTELDLGVYAAPILASRA